MEGLRTVESMEIMNMEEKIRDMEAKEMVEKEDGGGNIIG